MSTITIPQKEYKRLKQRSTAYERIAEEIIKAEREYPYDYEYVDLIVQETEGGKWIEAKSVDEALAKAHKR